MPAPERTDRRQKALLWEKTGINDNGEITVSGSPVEIMVRWKRKRGETVNRKGETVSVDASATVGQKITAGSRMWLGSLAEWYGTGSAGDESDVMEVMSYSETPDVKAREKTQKVMLRLFRDAPH